MLKSAEESIVLVTTEKGISRKLSYFGKTLEKAAKRGVKVKIAANITDKNLLKQLSFAEVRSSDINSRFTVVDGKEVLFMILNDEEVHPSFDVGVWVNAPFFAGALDSLFNIAWKEMQITK